jgi:aromatic ring-opening dioxygenase LigB subunit
MMVDRGDVKMPALCLTHGNSVSVFFMCKRMIVHILPAPMYWTSPEIMIGGSARSLHKSEVSDRFSIN